VSSEGSMLLAGGAIGAIVGTLMTLGFRDPNNLHTLRCYDTAGKLVLKADARVRVPNEDGEPVLYTGEGLEVAGCKVEGKE
jgi:hypothetical protein